MELYKYFDLENRTFGLLGVWGYIVRQWLTNLLPIDCHIILSNRLFVFMRSITPTRLFTQSVFISKNDVIDCLMASCHIPILLDLAPFATFRNKWYIDGQLFLSKSYMVKLCPNDAIVFDYYGDQNCPNKSYFMKALNVHTLKAMTESGFHYCDKILNNKDNVTNNNKF